MLHGFPWVCAYSCCHQMTTQQQLKGPRALSEVNQKSQTHAGLKTVKSSLVGPHMGANLRKLEIAPRTPIVG